MTERTIELLVNGRRERWRGDPAEPLLWALRDRLNLPGTKYGCGIGACGACTVHVGGAARAACVVPVGTVGGQAVVTIEGLGTRERLHPVQQAWIEANVPQCGYCQCGQMMASAALLARTPAPSDAQIDEALRANLCRCGTYARIRPAVHRAAELLRQRGAA